MTADMQSELVGGEVTLNYFWEAYTKPGVEGDIVEHLPTLRALASECKHVTEFGTRSAVSTVAFLMAQPDKLVCYDVALYLQVRLLADLTGRTEFEFHHEDVLCANIEETDLLFIDTYHVYEQLKEELRLHSHKVRKYIVLHDTETYRDVGQTFNDWGGYRGSGKGLWPAVEEFLSQGRFKVKVHYPNNNGLTVLERITKE